MKREVAEAEAAQAERDKSYELLLEKAVPIANFDEMEFIFQDKHATGEFMVLQTPYDMVHALDKDFIGDTNKNASDVEVDPATHYDLDCIPDDTNNESSSSKHP
ncbi:hypothetical protein D1007_52565 [Hordeum vulgare]|nr:hypothetical protein D1007_52565 [Hordeum vulgare]